MPLTPVPILTLDAAVASLVPGRPLVVSDADEVLLHFVTALKAYAETRNLVLRMESFGITGNLKDKDTGAPLAREAVSAFLKEFFLAVDTIPPVEGAAEALEDLSGEAQILILSNVPKAAADNRARNLARAGFRAALVQNDGLKGDALARLAGAAQAPVAFIDDIPHHHESCAVSAPDIHRLHFIANPDLARQTPKAEAAHARIDRWHEAAPWLRDRLGLFRR